MTFRGPWLRLLLVLAPLAVSACRVPLGAPGSPDFRPLVAPERVARPALSVTVLERRGARAVPTEEEETQVVVRALRTSGLFASVEPAGSELQARILIEGETEPGWEAWLACVFAFWRAEVRLELELVDARGATLFRQAGEREWTVLASPLLLPLRPFTSYERRDEALHALVREVLQAALASGALKGTKP